MIFRPRCRSRHGRLIKANVETIEKSPIQRFLGMAGYYRKCCQNFSDVATKQTYLLVKTVKYVWSEEIENGFNKINAKLISEPVLMALDFQKQFKLAIHASTTRVW